MQYVIKRSDMRASHFGFRTGKPASGFLPIIIASVAGTLVFAA
jgi:hypothetical protein